MSHSPLVPEEERFKSDMDSKLGNVHKYPPSPPRLAKTLSGEDTDATTTMSHTPQPSTSPPRIITELPTPSTATKKSFSGSIDLTHFNARSPSPSGTSPDLSPDPHTHYTASTPLNISAIVKGGSPTDSHSPHPVSPVMSTLAEVGLENIAEGEEDEGLSGDEILSPSAEELSPLDPTNIQGLRFSVDPSVVPLYSSSSLPSNIGSPLDDNEYEDCVFDPVGEREPGNPLFPGKPPFACKTSKSHPRHLRIIRSTGYCTHIKCKVTLYPSILLVFALTFDSPVTRRCAPLPCLRPLDTPHVRSSTQGVEPVIGATHCMPTSPATAVTML